MLRCRDVCVPCAGGRTTMGLLSVRPAAVRGIASHAHVGARYLRRSTQTGLKIHGQRSRAAVLAAGEFQKRKFSTTTARGISEEEIDELRTQISMKEQMKEIRRKKRDEDHDDGYNNNKLPERRPKPAMSSRALEEEMRWLKDPAELANRVKAMLTKGEVEKAAMLVRQAQKDGSSCIVAWNHIMDYEMGKGRSESAFKFYNDMKKRGRKPDAHTYTIMFRGLASGAVSSKSVPTALSIYESLCSPSSEVKPSTIHANAALNVCARHGNMEALWELAGKLPVEGYGAPDARTYTIILNAIRASTTHEIKDLDRKSQLDGILATKALAVREGKRMWTDIVGQWRNGKLFIDAHLVNAMGRLLVFGEREGDYRDTLSLIHQTMGIQVVGPRRGEERRLRIEQYKAADQGVRTQENAEFADIVKEPGASEERKAPEPEEQPELSEDKEFKGLFEPVPLTQVRRNAELKAGVKSLPDLEFPAPTNSELTLLMEACTKMHNGIGPGRSYWHLLTSETEGYKIIPDQNSYLAYLRLLRVGRASAESLRVLRAMVPQFRMLANKTYLVAMSTCLRDRNNPNVISNANGMIDLMASTRAESDPKTLDKYIELIRLFTGQVPGSSDPKSAARFDVTKKTGPEVQKAILTKALRNIKPHIERLKDALENGDIAKYARRSTKYLFGEEIDGEPRRFRGLYGGGHPIDVNHAMSFLHSALFVYKRILGPEIRKQLSQTDVELYRKESSALEAFTEAQKKKDIWDKFVFAVDRKKTAEVRKWQEVRRTVDRKKKQRQERRSTAKSTGGE